MPRGKQIKGILEDAKTLGVSRQHLYAVLSGKRKGADLLMRYETLQESKPPPIEKPTVTPLPEALPGRKWHGLLRRMGRRHHPGMRQWRSVLKHLAKEIAAYGNCDCTDGGGRCCYCLCRRIDEGLGPWTHHDEEDFKAFMDACAPIRLVVKRPVGETLTGATDGTTVGLDRISRSETVTLSGKQELSGQQIDTDAARHGVGVANGA